MSLFCSLSVPCEVQRDDGWNSFAKRLRSASAGQLPNASILKINASSSGLMTLNFARYISQKNAVSYLLYLLYSNYFDPSIVSPSLVSHCQSRPLRCHHEHVSSSPYFAAYNFDNKQHRVCSHLASTEQYQADHLGRNN